LAAHPDRDLKRKQRRKVTMTVPRSYRSIAARG
jgi:hypothetical protein